jgi:hypothetical protein
MGIMFLTRHSVSLSVRVSSYVVARIATTFVDGYTRNFGKLSVIVKAWMGLIFRKICQGDHFFLEGDLVKFVS